MSLDSKDLDLEIYRLYANRIDQILVAANVGLWDWNMKTNSVQFDRIWAALIGYDIAEIKFELSFWQDRVHPDDLDTCYSDIRDHLEGRKPCYENIHRMKHKNGEWIYILDRGKVTDWEDGEPVRFMGTHVDITELMQSRMKIENLINESIQAAQTKSTFLANISHEIRSPLNAIIGFAEIGLEDDLSEDQKENLQFIHTSACKILALTNDFLDFSKIVAGKFELHNSPCELNHIFDNILKTYQISANDKGIKLGSFISPEVPDALFLDSLRLNQILTNLVGNAIKFTGKEGWVYLTAQVNKQSDNTLTLLFSVVDTGIGIPREHQEKIFLDYSQADSSIAHNFGGTGLGLSISSNLIELMGGEIWLISEQDIGSTFYFTIQSGIDNSPASSDAGGTVISSSHDFVKLNGAKLLLVEDDDINRELAMAILQDFDIDVKTATNGQDALNILSKEKFDCVLMDCHMPIMNGCEATRQLREQKNLKDLPIIAMTASDQNQYSDESFRLLFDAYISKPYDPDAMLSTIAKYIK